MRLKAEEKQLIISRREKIAKEKAHDKKTIILLKTALNYEIWLNKQNNLAFGSFSTFVNDFGYTSEQPKIDYDVVCAILKTAHERG